LSGEFLTVKSASASYGGVAYYENEYYQVETKNLQGKDKDGTWVKEDKYSINYKKEIALAVFFLFLRYG
jgi:hypothetical protein